MKNLLLFFSLLLLCLFHASAQTFTGKEAESKIQGTKMIQYSERSSRPEFIEFSESSVYKNAGADPAETIRKILGFAEDEQLVRMDESKDDLGFTHTKYRQHYKNIPVEGAEYIYHQRFGNLDCMNGLVFKLADISTTPVLDEESALKNAITHVGAKKYMWENASLIAELREAFENPSFNYDPKGVLVIYPVNNEFSEKADFRLAYKFDIYAEEPESRAYIFVDAHNGEIIGTQERIHTADTKGTAQTKYSGTRTITTDQVSATSYRLKETGRGNGIETRNVKTATSTASAVDFTDTDNDWNNVNAAMDEAAPDAHWATEMTYDYFKLVHNRNSIDNKGFKLLNYVHWDKKWFNASWNGQFMRYGDGTGTKPLTTVDIGSHEMTHGLTEHSAGLVYQGESGALNESFSDIFGNAVEMYAKPTAAKWTMGEDIGAIRDMKNPNAFTDPDTYKGTYWASTSGADQGGVHTNSGVQNYWFYVLSDGASGTNDINTVYKVTGIGIDKAAKVAFRNLTVYLTSSSNYTAARTGALKAATDLFGYCSPEYIATADAWNAVGVGATSGCTNVGVEDMNTFATVNMYPNPSNGIVYVESQKTEGPINVSVYSMMGEVVYTETYNTRNDKSHKMDLSSLSNGVYFVKLQKDSEFTTVKIALNH